MAKHTKQVVVAPDKRTKKARKEYYSGLRCGAYRARTGTVVFKDHRHPDKADRSRAKADLRKLAC